MVDVLSQPAISRVSWGQAGSFSYQQRTSSIPDIQGKMVDSQNRLIKSIHKLFDFFAICGEEREQILDIGTWSQIYHNGHSEDCSNEQVAFGIINLLRKYTPEIVLKKGFNKLFHSQGDEVVPNHGSWTHFKCAIREFKEAFFLVHHTTNGMPRRLTDTLMMKLANSDDKLRHVFAPFGSYMTVGRFDKTTSKTQKLKNTVVFWNDTLSDSMTIYLTCFSVFEQYYLTTFHGDINRDLFFQTDGIPWTPAQMTNLLKKAFGFGAQGLRQIFPAIANMMDFDPECSYGINEGDRALDLASGHSTQVRQKHYGNLVGTDFFRGIPLDYIKRAELSCRQQQAFWGVDVPYPKHLTLEELVNRASRSFRDAVASKVRDFRLTSKTPRKSALFSKEDLKEEKGKGKAQPFGPADRPVGGFTDHAPASTPPLTEQEDRYTSSSASLKRSARILVRSQGVIALGDSGDEKEEEEDGRRRKRARTAAEQTHNDKGKGPTSRQDVSSSLALPASCVLSSPSSPAQPKLATTVLASPALSPHPSNPATRAKPSGHASHAVQLLPCSPSVPAATGSTINSKADSVRPRFLI